VPYNRSPTPRRSGPRPSASTRPEARYPTTGARPRDGRDLIRPLSVEMLFRPTTGARPRDGRDRATSKQRRQDRVRLQQEPDPETVGTRAGAARRPHHPPYNRSPTPRRSGLHHPDAHHIGVVLPTTGARPRDGRDECPRLRCAGYWCLQQEPDPETVGTRARPVSIAVMQGAPTTGARPRDGRDRGGPGRGRPPRPTPYNRSPTPRRSGRPRRGSRADGGG